MNERIEIDRSLLVLCRCGCGEFVNERHLVALAYKDVGWSNEDIADELDVSASAVSEMLKRARARQWPRRIRGHGAIGGASIPKVSAPEVEHEHEWRPTGFETIGRVLFRIDVCRLPGCRERRACRPSGPASLA